MNTDELKRLATELRGLKWEYTGEHYDDVGGRYREIVTSEGDVVVGEFSGPNSDEAKFIAAASPAVVLELINQLEVANRDAERYRYLRQFAYRSLRATAQVSVEFTAPQNDEWPADQDAFGDLDAAIDAAMKP